MCVCVEFIRATQQLFSLPFQQDLKLISTVNRIERESHFLMELAEGWQLSRNET